MKNRDLMFKLFFIVVAASLTAMLAGTCIAQSMTFALASLDGLKEHKVKAESVTYKGQKALRVTEAAGLVGANEDKLVIVTGSDLQDGIIEIDLAGMPGEGAVGGARGFVGIAFRVAPDNSKFECFYLRPTNGRAEDQERRNHSAQYISFPGLPWQLSRKETPSKYETYVDLVPGEWTKVKIEVQGEKARLYVHCVEQPTLLVNDLKLGATAKGPVALWIGPGTVAHFANLKISR
jgi:hypothetical protein